MVFRPFGRLKEALEANLSDRYLSQIDINKTMIPYPIVPIQQVHRGHIRLANLHHDPNRQFLSFALEILEIQNRIIKIGHIILQPVNPFGMRFQQPALPTNGNRKVCLWRVVFDKKSIVKSCVHRRAKGPIHFFRLRPRGFREYGLKGWSKYTIKCYACIFLC